MARTRIRANTQLQDDSINSCVVKFIGSHKLSNKVTKQGNVFNGPNQLVQLDGDGKLPSLDVSNLVGIWKLSLNTLDSLSVIASANPTVPFVAIASDVGLVAYMGDGTFKTLAGFGAIDGV